MCRLLPIVLALCAALAAEDSDPRKALDALLTRLGGDDAPEREAAQIELACLVDRHFRTIGPALRACQEGANAELKERLGREIAFLERLDSIEKTLSLFDVLELPDIAGKRLVLFNTGETGWRMTREEEVHRFKYVIGWIVEESPTEVTLLKTDLAVARLTRDRSRAKEWEQQGAHEPKDAPSPGEWKEVDFDDLVQDELSERRSWEYGEFAEYAGLLVSPGLQPYVYARWAVQRGAWRLAAALAEDGETAIRYAREHTKEGKYDSTELTLGGALAADLRYRAIEAAHSGAPREELLSRWKRIQGLPGSGGGGMVAAYESLLAEDEGFVPLPRKDVAKLPFAEQVRHWLHRLRDLAYGPIASPGGCIVVGFGGRGEDHPNPADELVALGWDALPDVIARLDDGRPTRCVNFWRSYDRGSYCLLSHGDCCEQVFSAITGVHPVELCFPDGPRGKRLKSREVAEAWWKEHSAQGAEAYYVGILDSAETSDHPKAVKALLALDAAKHLPRAMEAARRVNHPRCAELLGILRDHLGEAHREYMRGFLSDPRDDVAVEAAWGLWKVLGSDEGLDEVMKRLRAPSKSEDDFEVPPWGATRLLVEVGGDKGVAAFRELFHASDLQVRVDAIRSARNLPDPRIAEGLVELMGDDTASGWTGGISFRIRDIAAESLHEMLETLSPPPLAMKDEERDACIDATRAWWKERKGTIDWDAIRASRSQK